ncbi:MAG: hypothetical protein HC916_20205 [Coleofasciculaceae cyanobacterium SM2_1_6]|nr:hypothetical protein [Coleofasciculaceae cyanobacterium SM2_1_6]
MLVYLLAIASGSGSLALFLTAFFVPEIHRKGDFLWSGIGLFYALVLWVLAAQINGGLLLGETAGVTVLLWAILQVLQTRWQSLPIEQRSAPSVELVNKIEKVFSDESVQKLQAQAMAIVAKFDRSKTSKTSKTAKTEVTAPEIPVPEVIPEIIPEVTLEVKSETSPEAIPETIPETISETIPETNFNIPAPESNPPESNPTIEVQNISPKIASEPVDISPEPVSSPVNASSPETATSPVESIEPSHGTEGKTENATANSPDDHESSHASSDPNSDPSSDPSIDSEGEDI